MTVPFLKSKGDGWGWQVIRTSNFVGHKNKEHAKALIETFRETWPNSRWWLARVQLDQEFKAEEPVLSDAFSTNLLGGELQVLRLEKERAFIIEVEAPNAETPEGSFKVTISDGEFQGVFSSAELAAAIQGARASLVEARDKETIAPIEVPLHELKPMEPPRVKISAASLKVKR